jgi:Zn-dependent protease with chaperone function
MILVWVALAMAARDAISTLLTRAESRGKHWLAGGLDSLGDIAGVLSTVFGAGEIIVHGWGWRSLEILSVMVVVSFVGTTFWTWFAAKWMPDPAEAA